MTYVNYRGEEISLIDHGRPPRAKKEERSFHNGWRVQGIPPGAMEDAREANRRVAAMSNAAGGKPLPAFDPERWLMTAKSKPVRARPFEIRSAADECKALAESWDGFASRSWS